MAAAERWERGVARYPEGWFQVGYSAEMPVGAVVAKRYFGRELVVYRTQSGHVQVLDGYCVHLGAHLGVGGTVRGECLRCPFHAWEYGTDGVVQTIPYADRIPTGAAVRSWPTVERSGLVFAWHSDRGATPTWSPPELPEHGADGWTADYAVRRYELRSSPQEILENVFDVAHGQYVHANAQGMAQPTVDFGFEGHTASARFEIDIPVVGGATRHLVSMYGLGVVVNLSVGNGSKSFWTTYTPIELDQVEVHFSMLTALSTPEDPDGSRGERSAAGTLVAFEQDIPIWEHKAYKPVPLLCDGDRPIARYRTWIRQFYPASGDDQDEAAPALAADATP